MCIYTYACTCIPIFSLYICFGSLNMLIFVVEEMLICGSKCIICIHVFLYVYMRRMHVCIYVCMYVCMCMYISDVCMYLHMYVCIHLLSVYLYVHMYVCMYICLSVCMHVCICIYVYLYVYIRCVYVCIYICMCVCMYVYVCICMYVCMYIRKVVFELEFHRVHICICIYDFVCELCECTFIFKSNFIEFDRYSSMPICKLFFKCMYVYVMFKVFRLKFYKVYVCTLHVDICIYIYIY